MELRAIEHIGSTSIPNMHSKPTIDIAVAVNDLCLLPEIVYKNLKEIGFIFIPKPEFKDRLFFRKGDFGAGTHHLHVYNLGSMYWYDILFFRDYIKNNQEAFNNYLNLKYLLVNKGLKRQQYTAEKDSFIKEILSKRL